MEPHSSPQWHTSPIQRAPAVVARPLSSQYPPLTCAEVKCILRALGFEPRKSKGGSHEQWIKDDGGRRFKVTVDCPKAPFSQTLIASMARQAGVSKKAFYAARGREAAND
nr:type II toxin-antitoxin system HicA family toxin [Thiorhodococcus minor]